MGNRKAIPIIAVLAVLPCICFWEVFQGKLLLPTDWVYRDLEPWRRTKDAPEVVNSRIKDAFLDGYALDLVSARAAREGRIALWNPYAGGGIPHLAGGFSRMLYPPFWIYAVVDSETARNAEILLHLFLAELFALLFLKRLGCAWSGAFLGAVVYGFTPSITHRAEISFILPSLVWFPLLLLTVEDILTTVRWRSVAGLAGAVALQILAGHYPDIFIHFLGAAVYGTLRIVFMQGDARRFFRIFYCLAAVALGIALAAPFLFPSIGLILDSNRPLTPVDALASKNPASQLLLTLFSPWVQRSQLYIGILALIFVPAAFRRKDRGPSFALLATALTGLGVAMGGPLLDLLYSLVPPLRNLRYVQTLISLASFSLALLAGMGFSRTLQGDSRWERRVALGFLAAGTTVSSWAWLGGREDILARFRLPGLLILLVFITLALELYARRKVSHEVFVITTCFLVSLELMSYARLFNPRIDPKAFPPFPDFPSIAFLENDPERFRVATLLGNYNSPFWPNTLGVYGIEDVGAYHSLLPGQVGRYMERTRRYSGGSSYDELLEERDSSENWLWLSSFRPSHLVRLWNIKYFILPAGAPNPDPVWLDLVYDGEVRLYRFSGWLPRARLVHQPLVLANDRGIYMKLLESRFDPRQTVLLSSEPACWPPVSGKPVPSNSPDGVRIIAYKDQRMVFETRSPQASYLVLSETYDPGWKAIVDGTKAPILRANLNFRAIPLGPGEHRIIIFYDPASYQWGWIAFGLGMGCLAMLGLSWNRMADERIKTASLTLTLLPILIGSVGWRKNTVTPDSSCGQLQVTRRFLSPDNASLLELRNGSVLSTPIPIGSRLNWPVREKASSLLRIRTARRFRQGGPVQLTVSEGDNDEPPTAIIHFDRARPRWTHRDIPLPPGNTPLVFQAELVSSFSGSLSSLDLGSPMILQPRKRQPSIVVFLTPSATGDNWTKVEERLRIQSRVRILLTRADGRGARLEHFDEVYRSTTPEDFQSRMMALADELYRISTILILVPETETGQGDFAARQIERMREELRRLGLGKNDVELLQYPQGN